MPLFFGNGGVNSLVKKVIENGYLSLWRASFTYSYWKRPAMFFATEKYCCKPISAVWLVAIVFTHRAPEIGFLK
jgi:hypothetical protein